MFKSERVFDDNLLLSYFDDGYISDRIAIKDSEIHVWFLDIGNYDEYHMKSLFDILTLDEKAKMSHYVHVADQKRFLVGHSMLRILLSRYLAREPDDIILLNSKHGKLYMPQSNVSFNISHSGNRVALAFVKEKKIGVDIERMNSLDDYSQIAKNFFLPPESERICAQTDAAKGMEKFYEIWTVKEAFVKALGHGLSRSLKSFEVLEQGTINDYTNNSRYNYYTKPMSDEDQVIIVDDDGKEQPYGIEGEILVKGPYLFSGYYEMDSSECFNADGFYHTGDLGYITADGYIKITGRKSDQINRMGEKIMPSEIESYLAEHEKIMEVVVMGIPDTILGERSCAFLRMAKGNVKPEELREHLSKKGVAQYKVPDQMILLDEFPHTATGKINKRMLLTMANK